MTGTRLQIVLARAGVGSRRACEELIRQGEVSVNGRVVTEMGVRVEADDVIAVSGRRLRPAEEHRYLVLNKPREVVTTARDPEGRRTVLDFVPGLRERVWPVGRLDYHSEGLVILTNDGELTNALTHPSGHVPRVYHAKIDGQLDAEARDRLRRGIRLEGKSTGPIEARPLRAAAHSTEHAWVEVVVHEGRYHLVREALLRVGHPVSRLKRVAFGSLKLGRLPAGAVRELTPAEVESLRRAAKAHARGEHPAEPPPRRAAAPGPRRKAVGRGPKKASRPPSRGPRRGRQSS